MIYLIGGAPRCGKTTIAQKLSKELGISWIPADAIESMVARYILKGDLPRLFPKSIMRKKTKLSNDLMYGKYSVKEITDAYIKQSRASWKAVKVLTECALHEHHDFIIEGHQIHPQLIFQLKKEFKNIKGIAIVRTDLKSIVSGALKNSHPNDWFIKKTKKQDTYEKMGLMIKRYSQYFIKESSKYNIEVINTERDFKKQIKLAIKRLK
jgi:2-phosphoglycerate kinase